jgi:hypothetical protein
MMKEEEGELMEQLHKLETTVLGWLKNIPHLPISARKWLGTNAWWIVIVSVVIWAIWTLFTLLDVMENVRLLENAQSGFAVPPLFISPWSITTDFIAIFFNVIVLILCGLAIKPLQYKLKKGWVLLFLAWLISVVGLILDAILSLSPISFIFGLLFGAIAAGVTGYLLFEVHSQFAHDKKPASRPAPVEDEV